MHPPAKRLSILGCAIVLSCAGGCAGGADRADAGATHPHDAPRSAGDGGRDGSANADAGAAPVHELGRGIWRNAAPRPVRSTPGALVERPSPRTGDGVDGSSSTRTLILYDVTGEEGWLGQGFAVATANLASHFGAWHAVPAASYECGLVEDYTATIYLGSTWGEPLPDCLLDDVLDTRRPVIWTFLNLDALVRRAGSAAAFHDAFGFAPAGIDVTTRWESVDYRGRSLPRDPENVGMLALSISDPDRAAVVATARAEGGVGTMPWAVRSGHLTVVAEMPYAYMAEGDRYVVWADLLFDALAPGTLERHRALVRLEDISPLSSPADLRAMADYLSSAGVPFGFGVVVEHRDPDGFYSGGRPNNVLLTERPEVIEALHYLEAHGGTMVMHGRTHQWDGGPNPMNGVTGDDSEFIRVGELPSMELTLLGTLPEDSYDHWLDRIESAEEVFRDAGLRVPAIFEFPHYMASASAYAAAGHRMAIRWERALYFDGILSGGPIDHSRWFGQHFPYVVRDVYGARVLPENLGNVEHEAIFAVEPWLPEDIVGAAAANLVVRDGFASFFFHPYLPVSELREIVEGIRALGYEFVSPATL